MIIIDVCGGLGNQMFQYALYKSFLHCGRRALLDFTHISGDMSEIGRCTILDSFRLEKKMKSPSYLVYTRIWRKWVRKVFGEVREKENGIFDASVLQLKNGYLIGYWQSEQYFEECRKEICSAFTLQKELPERSRTILKQIGQAQAAVSVHVRLGDYEMSANRQIYGNICTPEYYEKAMQHILTEEPNALFFVFSNEIESAKELFSAPGCVFVETGDESKGWIDMYLMSQCKHHIIANSTFSWWGAWLNQNPKKIVIAPKVWLNTRKMPDVCPREWIRI